MELCAGRKPSLVQGQLTVVGMVEALLLSALEGPIGHQSTNSLIHLGENT